MQSFRKNTTYTYFFLGAAGIFGAIAFFEWYHGGRISPILIGVGAAWLLAAFWGRGTLLVVDNEKLTANLGMFTKKTMRLGDISEVRPDGKKRVIHVAGKNFDGKKIKFKLQLALVDPRDRGAFVERMEALAKRVKKD